MKAWPRLVLVLAGCCSAGARADQGDWFPPRCAADAPSGAGPELVWVRTALNDLGRDAVLRRESDGSLWAALEDLRQWVPDAPPLRERTIDGRQYFPLAEVPGLVTRLDRCRQELLVDWAAGARPENALRFGPNQHPVTRPDRPGGYLNLDLNYSDSDVAPGALAGLATLGAFSRWGSGRSGWLDAGAGDVVRLDSSWTYDWPERAQRLVAGDSVTRPAAWGTPVHYGGLRWGTEFSLQPEFITFPLPGVSGVARVPSTLDVYVNGVPRERADVPTGPYVLTDVPVFTGAGELQIEMLDALGRRQRIVQPFYAAPQLLKPGLDEHSVEAGWLRENYALASADYGDAFAAWSWRTGVTDTLTWQERIEASAGDFTMGTTLHWLWPWAGVWTTDTALSRSQRLNGALLGLGFERVDPHYSLSLRRRGTIGAFAQLGQQPGELQRSDLARLSFPVWGNATLSFAAIDERRLGTTVRLLGISAAAGLGRYVSAFGSVTIPEGGERQYYAGLICHLGGSRWLGLQGQRQGDFSSSRLLFQQGLQGALGPDFRLVADGGDSDLREASGHWTATRGAASADWTTHAGVQTWQLGGRSALALLGDGIYWTRPVENAFAVVDTGGVPGVRVYRDNLLVGTSDADGHLLVPELRPYESNLLRVDELDWPLSRNPVRTEDRVAPVAGAGVTVAFATAPAAVALQLRQADGTPVPAGAALTVNGTPVDLPVGYDGAAYLEIGSGRQRVEARWADGRCVAEFSASPAGAQAPLDCVTLPP